ncbi:MAG: hypothetical protein QM689_07685 [Oscillospiraceae bacterium]
MELFKTRDFTGAFEQTLSSFQQRYNLSPQSAARKGMPAGKERENQFHKFTEVLQKKFLTESGKRAILIAK